MMPGSSSLRSNMPNIKTPLVGNDRGVQSEAGEGFLQVRLRTRMLSKPQKKLPSEVQTVVRHAIVKDVLGVRKMETQRDVPSNLTSAFVVQSDALKFAKLISTGKRSQSSMKLHLAYFHYVKNKNNAQIGAQAAIANLFSNLMDDWKLSKKNMATLLGLDFDASGQEYVRNLLNRMCSFSGRDARYRMAQLIQIREILFALFKDHAVENEWLREKQSMLNDKAPMDLLLQGSMKNLVLVREFVEAVAGR